MADKQHIYALFEDPDAAFAAYHAVVAGGCSSEHCSAVLHENRYDDSLDPVADRASREGAIRGATLGGIVGAVLGGAAVIAGGVVTIGPVAAAVLGGGVLAAYGALTGGIAGADEPQKELRELEQDVINGLIVISLETDDPELEKMCEAVFKRYGGKILG